MPKLVNETYDEPLTIEWIITNLKKDGYGTKQKVAKRLEQALIGDLTSLKRSIEKEIYKRLDEEHPQEDNAEEAMDILRAIGDDE